MGNGKSIQLAPHPQRPQETVEHTVFIGHSCHLRSGITIGTDNLIAANSVVPKGVKPFQWQAPILPD